jgi:hypothetical protein
MKRVNKNKVFELVNPVEIIILPHMLAFEHSIIHLN